MALTLPPSPMQALQADHERLLGRLDDVGGAPCPGTSPIPFEDQSFEIQALIHEARAYIERSKAEAEWIQDARDRSQLRANLRFWASFLVNCTGVYPDTTLRPHVRFQQNIQAIQRPSREALTSGGLSGKPPSSVGTATSAEPAGSEAENDVNEAEISDGTGEVQPGRPAWSARLSRTFGLFAILIVGVIPLAAVCLALSLFYNLDNRSPWASAGEAATQTAIAVLQLPSPTPLRLKHRYPPTRVTRSSRYSAVFNGRMFLPVDRRREVPAVRRSCYSR